jgi:hypothetical protein
MKVSVVCPDVLRELELTNEARADYEGRNAALGPIVGDAFRQMGSVSRAPTDLLYSSLPLLFHWSLQARKGPAE